MKKQVKLISGLMALVLCLGMLGGCGSKEDEAEKIIDKAVQKLKDVDSMTTKMEFLADASIGSKKSKVNMTMDFLLELDQMIKTQEAHGEGYMKIESFGVKEEVDIEMYVLKEGKEFLQYASVDGDWSVDEMEESDLGLLNAKDMVETLKYAEKLKSSGTDTIDGKKIDVISCEVSGETIENAMSILPIDDLTMNDDMELKDANITMEASFYQDSGLPARLTMDLSKLLNEIMKSDSVNDTGMDIEVSDLQLQFTFENYNEVKEFEIPDDLDDKVLNDTWDYDEDFDEGVNNPSGPWTSYEFILEGKTYKLPVAYNDFVEAGWEIDSASDRRTKVQGDSEEYYIMVSNEKGEEIHLTFYNDSKETKPITECLVTSIDVEDTELNDFDFSLPGGVKLGMSEDELNAIYKEYSSRHNYSDITEYFYHGETYDDSIHITIIDDMIYSLSIEHK